MIEFFSYMGTVSFQVLILFIMSAVGFIISKAKMINENGAAQITNILLYIVTPCVIISSFECMEFNENSVNELLISAACAVFTHIIGFILGALFSAKGEKHTYDAYMHGCAVQLRIYGHTDDRSTARQSRRISCFRLSCDIQHLCMDGVLFNVRRQIQHKIRAR